MVIYNDEIVQRNDVDYLTTVKDKNEEAVDLTGCSLTYVVADAVTNESVITKTIEGGGIKVMDAVNGVVQIELNKDDTDISADSYKHELLLVDSNEERHTSFKGRLKVIESIID